MTISRYDNISTPGCNIWSTLLTQHCGAVLEVFCLLARPRDCNKSKILQGWCYLRESCFYPLLSSLSFIEGIVNYNSLLYWIIFQCTLYFDQLRGGCGSITPLNLINSLYQGFDRGNSLYHKFWTHLDNREKCGLKSTKKNCSCLHHF